MLLLLISTLNPQTFNRHILQTATYPKSLIFFPYNLKGVSNSYVLNTSLTAQMLSLVLFMLWFLILVPLGILDFIHMLVIQPATSTHMILSVTWRWITSLFSEYQLLFPACVLCGLGRHQLPAPRRHFLLQSNFMETMTVLQLAEVGMNSSSVCIAK